MTVARRLRGLARDQRGNVFIEFAIIAPAMMMVLMGLGDLLYQAYAQSLLDGALQKAARDSAIQGGAQVTDALDAKVVDMVGTIMPDPVKGCGTPPAAGTWCSSRKSYYSFTAITPEDFDDTNKNGVRDPGECFYDVNGNGTYDSDRGVAGQGGADDVTMYTFSITYARLFPVAGLLGFPSSATITAKTILKNQPYATQAAAASTKICT